MGHTISTHAARAPEDASRPAYERLREDEFPRVREARIVPAGARASVGDAVGMGAVVLDGLAAQAGPPRVPGQA